MTAVCVACTVGEVAFGTPPRWGLVFFGVAVSFFGIFVTAVVWEGEAQEVSDDVQR
jgi:hypothetical protein